MRNLLVEWTELEEGFSAKPYRDSRGIWTVGFGRNLKANPEPPRNFWEVPCTRDEAEQWLAEHLRGVYLELRERRPVIDRIVPARAAALLQMAYQMGIAGVLGFVDMWAAVERGQWEEAGQHALDSAWARQTPARAHRVAMALKSGDWPAEVRR